MLSGSRATIKKLYLKNNRLDTLASASALCELVDVSQQIVTVVMNWSGIKLELEPGVAIKAVSTKNGAVIAQKATTRMFKVGS